MNDAQKQLKMLEFYRLVAMRVELIHVCLGDPLRPEDIVKAREVATAIKGDIALMIERVS